MGVIGHLGIANINHIIRTVHIIVVNRLLEAASSNLAGPAAITSSIYDHLII